MNDKFKKNCLIINLSDVVKYDFVFSLAKNNCDIVLNGWISEEKILETIYSVENLGVKCFHHNACIEDISELTLLLEDSERLLGQIDLILIINNSIDLKSMFSVFDRSFNIMNKQKTGILVNLFLSLENRKELNDYCLQKIEQYPDIRYIELDYKDQEMNNTILTDNL